MKYLSIAQTAERWGISTRRIQIDIVLVLV